MAAAQQKDRDFYSVLGIGEDCKAEALRAAYLNLALKHHPDRNPGDRAAEEMFKAVSQAYAVLRDPPARARYDRLLAKKRSRARPRDASGHSAKGRSAGRQPTKAAGQADGNAARQGHGRKPGPDAGRDPAGARRQAGAGRDASDTRFQPGEGRNVAGAQVRTGAGRTAATQQGPPGAGHDASGPRGRAGGASQAAQDAASRLFRGAGEAASGTGHASAGTYDSFGRAAPPPGSPRNRGKDGGPEANAAPKGKAAADPEDIIQTFFTTPDGRVSLKMIKEELVRSGLSDRNPVLDHLNEKVKPRPLWSPLKDAVTSRLKRIKGKIFSNPLAPEGPKLAEQDLVFSLALSPEAAMSGTTVEVQYIQDGRDRRLSVRVPPKSKDGARLRLPGQGNLKPDGKRGDLLLNVTVPSPASRTPG
jgi:DnaJ-class molecular chaperone